MTLDPDAFELNRDDLIPLNHLAFIHHLVIDDRTALFCLNCDRLEHEVVG